MMMKAEPLIRMKGRAEDAGYKALAKAYRAKRKALDLLSGQVLLFLDLADRQFMKDQTVPYEAGARMARLLNALDLTNDLIRYSELGVNYRTDNKPAAVARLIAKMANGVRQIVKAAKQ
jgi:hypothetical protein